jgi:hypothetical protein
MAQPRVLVLACAPRTGMGAEEDARIDASVGAEVRGYGALGGQLALQAERNIAPEGLRSALDGQGALVFSGHGNLVAGTRWRSWRRTVG